MYYKTKNQNDNLLNFLEELENTLPRTVNVSSFSSNDTNCTINLQVDSKEAAAKTIQDIRKFDTVAVVTVGGISEEINDLGGSIVTFTLNITYEPVNNENENFEVNGRSVVTPLTSDSEQADEDQPGVEEATEDNAGQEGSEEGEVAE